jgi:5-formyltetrahydrofolate cyclo-ligase
MGEVRTSDIVAESWEEGKDVCVPAYDEKCEGYRFARFTSEMKLISGRFGVSEPLIPEWVQLDDVEMIIVPGLAFDMSGGRVGHGGGYYDRILQQRRGGPSVAAAFEFQVRDQVPMTSHDVRMDFVVTEKRTIPTGLTPGL